MTAPGTHVIIMKAGAHAGEDLTSIIARKQREAATAGWCLWGYGGSACHPLTQVQPHAQTAPNGVTVLFIATRSVPALSPSASREYSADAGTWTPIPHGHLVTGSKWALVLTSLTPASHTIDLGGRVTLRWPHGRLSSGQDCGMLAVMEGTRVRAADAHAAWSERFNELFAQVAGNFPNARARGHGRAYLLGLLSHQERKTSWQLAEFAGDATPDGLQKLLNSAPWDEGACRDAVARYVTREFGDPGAVLAVDETGFLKKGR
jgi:hypothetical protein